MKVMIEVGKDNLRKLIEGEKEMDVNLRDEKMEKKMKVMIGIIGYWNREIWGYGRREIINYEKRI